MNAPAEVARLAANLAKLKARCRDGVPYASGCSGTGMDDHVTDLVAEEAHRRFGIGTRWRSLLQVEKDARKRRWLNHFTSSDALMADVNELRQGPAVDTLSGMEYGLPDWVFKYSFGFSCKDFSTLNNSWNQDKDTQADLLEKGEGTSGVTFVANMCFVEVMRLTYICA